MWRFCPLSSLFFLNFTVFLFKTLLQPTQNRTLVLEVFPIVGGWAVFLEVLEEGGYTPSQLQMWLQNIHFGIRITTLFTVETRRATLSTQ